jgi:hypothetical protein
MIWPVTISSGAKRISRVGRRNLGGLPTEWGAKEGDALTRDEILHAANYQFDVWAGGYNWLQSNKDSGAAIKDLIENTILPYYNKGKRVTVKDTPDGEGKINAVSSARSRIGRWRKKSLWSRIRWEEWSAVR